MARNVASLLLTLFLVVIPITLASADFSTGSGTVGTVTGSGTLLLRGIEVRQVGTIFSGDNIHTGDKSQANLIFANGNRVRLASNTTFATNRNNQGIVQVSLISGEMAFSASRSPVTIVCGDYQITPGPNSSGGVAIVNSDIAAVRVATGSVTLRHIKDRSVIVLSSGSEHILNITPGQQRHPVQVASTMPTPIPAGQQGKASGTGVHWALWGPVIAGAAAGAGIIAYEVTKCTQASPSAPCQ
jgi:hypothetical protein